MRRQLTLHHLYASAVVVPVVAVLMMIASACTSDATSKAGTGGTIATDGSETTTPATDDTGTVATPTTIDCRAVDGPPPPSVKLGDCGDFVIELQTRLSEAGFVVSADGLFNAETEQAVKAFQTDRGLEVDGIVGPLTWGALVEFGTGD